MRPSNNLENKTLSDTYWTGQLVCMKVQARSSLEPPLEYKQDQMPSRFVMTFLTILGVVEICSFRLVLERKTGKEIPESSKLELLKKFSGNNFALSDAEDNSSGPLNRGGIVDLPLLRTLLAICQKSWEPSFWELMDSFILVAYVSLPASRTFVQWLLACLNLTLDSKDLLCWYKQKSGFYELWQQHKLLKTMEMSEVWPDTYD